MKKVIFFVTGLDSGGLENYLLRFLEFKANEIDNIIVFCKGGKAGQLEDKYRAISNVSLCFKKISYFNPKDYWFLYRFLVKNKLFAVCDFTGNFAGLILLSAKWAGVPKRIAFYRGSDNHFKESIYRLLYNQIVKKLIFKYATNILSNSKAAFNFFFPKQWKVDTRFEVIYNGIDANSFISSKESLHEELNIPSDAFVVGHVGRYNEAKNHKTIIEVAVQLCKQDSNNFFLFCGKDTDVFLSERVQREGLEKQIKLLGLRSDVYKVLNTLDCFYFPSLSEGQPNALIEALVVGLPFVASNIGPIKETIPDIYHTQLIDPIDIKIALEKIENIKKNEDFAKSLNISEWAIKTYDPEILFNNFLKKLIE